MVVIGAEEIRDEVQIALIMTTEHHARIVVHRELTGDRGAGDRVPRDPLREFGIKVGLDDVGKQLERAVLICAHALGDGQELLARLQEVGQLFTRPLDTKRVHAAHDNVCAVDNFLCFLELMSGDTWVDFEAQIRVDASLLDRIDNLTVKEGTDEMDIITVF